MLTPGAILTALSHRLETLTTERRDLPERHRSLRESIRWSYQLLPDFKQFFAKLSVFRGGWTAEAAKEVCEEPDAYKLLEHIRDRSLVTSADPPRFTMLETIREFAREEVDNSEVLSRRHAEFFCSLAAQSHERALGAEQAKWLAILDAESENMREALRWATENANDIAIELAAWLWFYWNVKGSQKEAHYWLSLAVDGATSDCNQIAYGRALHGLGAVQRGLGEVDNARATLTKSIRVYEDSGERSRVGNPLNSLGVLEYKCGNTEIGRTHLLKSLGVFQDAENEQMIAMVRANIGDLELRAGDLGAARENLGEALQLNRKIGNRVWEAQNLEVLGGIEVAANNPRGARELFEDSLAISRKAGYKTGVAVCLGQLSEVALSKGDYREALSMIQEALSLHLEVDKVSGIAGALRGSGVIASLLHDDALAVSIWGAAASLGQPWKHRTRNCTAAP